MSDEKNKPETELTTPSAKKPEIELRDPEYTGYVEIHADVQEKPIPRKIRQLKKLLEEAGFHNPEISFHQKTPPLVDAAPTAELTGGGIKLTQNNPIQLTEEEIEDGLYEGLKEVKPLQEKQMPAKTNPDKFLGKPVDNKEKPHER